MSTDNLTFNPDSLPRMAGAVKAYIPRIEEVAAATDFLRTHIDSAGWEGIASAATEHVTRARNELVLVAEKLLWVRYDLDERLWLANNLANPASVQPVSVQTPIPAPVPTPNGHPAFFNFADFFGHLAKDLREVTGQFDLIPGPPTGAPEVKEVCESVEPVGPEAVVACKVGAGGATVYNVVYDTSTNSGDRNLRPIVETIGETFDWVASEPLEEQSAQLKER